MCAEDVMVAVLVVGLIIIGYAALSAPLDRRGVTSAMAFVAAGFLLAQLGIGLRDVSLETAVAEKIAELALVFLLFSDSMRLDLPSLRKDLVWPTRLLLIGLPLTLLLGFGAGLLVLPVLGVAGAFLLSTMLCATDAALGQRVVDDPDVPSRVRQALDVESGLNDGLAVPFFLVALDISLATLVGRVPSAIISNAAAQIGWGLTAGLVAGVGGGLLFRVTKDRGWLATAWQQVFPLAVALSAYAIAATLGGSGFIAAFVAGLAFGTASRESGSHVTYLTEEAGNVLAAVTWIGFGALALVAVLPHITWRVVLYAVLSLTVVRLVPVAIALAGTGARRQTVSFMGWFGPRGLASVVFTLLAVEEGVPDASELLATVTVTVALSVLLHGLTAGPLVARYHRWYTENAVPDPSAAEGKDTPLPRPRRAAGARPLAATPASGPEA
jgi:sodium/hydrogen antiporter